MEFTQLTYSLYCIVMVLIIGWAGWHLHSAGRPFVRAAFGENNLKADQTNNLLLIGYYLVNIGYSLMQVGKLGRVDDLNSMLEVLSHQLGSLVILLGILHYINMFVLWYYKRKVNEFLTHK